MDVDAALLVVEGLTDRRALAHLLHPNVRVVPAKGKDALLAAYDELGRSGRRSGVYFIADCDDRTASERMGLPDLSITEYRDLEADLVFVLRSFERVALDYLSDTQETVALAEASAERVLQYAVSVAVQICRIRQLAAGLGMRVRFVDSKGQRRPVRPWDISRQLLVLEDSAPIGPIVKAVAGHTGWTIAERRSLLRELDVLNECEHAAPICDGCNATRYCSGHDLVHALTLALIRETGLPLQYRDIERLLRVASDHAAATSWIVRRRARGWEQETGLRLFRRDL